MIKRRTEGLLGVTLLVALSLSLTACDIPFMPNKAETATQEAQNQSTTTESNVGVPFSANKISKGGNYVYLNTGTTLVQFNSVNSYSKSTILTAPSGTTISNPIVVDTCIFYLQTDSDKKVSLVKYDTASSKEEKILENLDGTDRIYYENKNIYLTVQKDKKVDLVKVSISDGKQNTIASNVIANNIYPANGVIYYEKEAESKVHMFSFEDNKETRLSEMAKSPFVIVKDRAYFTTGYDYIQATWSEITKLNPQTDAQNDTTATATPDKTAATASTATTADKTGTSPATGTTTADESKTPPATGTVSTDNTAVPPATEVVSTDETKTPAKANATKTDTAKATAAPAIPKEFSKIYSIPLTAGASKSEVYTKAPVGMITGSGTSVFFSNLYNGNYRGVIKLSTEERKETLAYKEEFKITSLLSADSKIYFTVAETNSAYIMSETGADLQELK